MTKLGCCRPIPSVLIRTFTEKAQQVLIWRGEETAYTGGAIRIIPQFAETLDSLNIAPENFTISLVKDPLEIPVERG
jgi:hypothetical protein